MISDGSAFTDRDTPLASVMRQHATTIQDVAGLPTRVIPLKPEDSHHIEDVLDRLPPEIGAVFLSHTDPHNALKVQNAASGPPVITDQDTTAIALTAALLTTLSQGGHPPQASRVVIAGAQTMPILCPLLMVAGIGDITVWDRADATAFPLRRIVEGSDAVIDLLSSGTSLTGSFTTSAAAVVITPDRARHPLLALPGLLRALMQVPNRQPDVEVHLACAFTLVMATPPDQQLPYGSDQALADQVADTAARALRHPAGRPHDTGSPPAGCGL